MLWFYDLLSLVILIGFAFAFLDAARRPSHAFEQIGTMKKPLWLILLGIGTVSSAGPFLYRFGLYLPFLDFFRRGLLFLIFLIVLVYYLGPIRQRMGETFGGPERPSRGSWG